MASMSLLMSGRSVEVDLDIYRSLFDNSVVHRLKKYDKSITQKSIPFADFVELSRKAEIPYTIFFAPKSFVDANIKRKNTALLQGITKRTFSINSRGSIEIRDIELIVKDILRKQGLLKTYKKVGDNKLLDSLKYSRLSLVEQAENIREIIGLEISTIKILSKTRTLEYLINLLGDQNIFVSQSSRFFMPQLIHDSVTFSGVCIKDKKYPFIFLNNKDESKSFEPEGRKIFTLALLAVCIAKGKFSPLSYNEQSKSLVHDEIYRIAEELLMPKTSVDSITVNSIDDLKDRADILSVTPSALLMRLQRLGLLELNDIRDYRTVLRDEFRAAPKPRARTPKPVNGFKKYNSPGYSRAMFELVDKRYITKREARRVLTQNKQSIRFLEEYRMNL